MTDGLKVTIAGLSFYGVGETGFIIGKDGFTGWQSGVDMRLDKTARPQAHGAFTLPGFQDGRVIAVSGEAFADTPRQLGYMQERFTGLLAGGGLGRIQVERFGDIRWADGQLVRADFTEDGGSNSATYQIQLWCPDPRKFGDSNMVQVSVGAPISISHRGNYEALPSFIVRGSMPGGYTLTLNGWDYTVSRALVTGQPHRIDYNDGLLYVNGTLTDNSFGNTNTEPIPPGQLVGLGLYPGTTGTGTADVTITDTYI